MLSSIPRGKLFLLLFHYSAYLRWKLLKRRSYWKNTGRNYCYSGRLLVGS